MDMSSKADLLFQSTLLQEERPLKNPTVLSSFKFQSTLLQEERHGGEVRVAGVDTISIHAPTRGATQMTVVCGIVILFQSTLLQEERQCWFD